jgi:hypothetical protein
MVLQVLVQLIQPTDLVFLQDQLALKLLDLVCLPICDALATFAVVLVTTVELVLAEKGIV